MLPLLFHVRKYKKQIPFRLWCTGHNTLGDPRLKMDDALLSANEKNGLAQQVIFVTDWIHRHHVQLREFHTVH